jgi:hypothetical protein
MKTSEFYTVEAVFDNEEFKGGVYVIRNRETGVVEMETTIWPQALTYLQSLEDHLKQLDEGEQDEEVGKKIVVEAVH